MTIGGIGAAPDIAATQVAQRAAAPTAKLDADGDQDGSTTAAPQAAAANSTAHGVNITA